MHDLLQMGSRAAALLKARGEKVSVGETSAGGLISAALLAVPGASSYFAGGAITYSKRSIRGLAGISIEEMLARDIRSSSEPYAEWLAEAVRAKHGDRVLWGLSETGAAGPGGNRYGDPSGHTCIAVVGPVKLVRTIRTGSDDRVANSGCSPTRRWRCWWKRWKRRRRRCEANPGWPADRSVGAAMSSDQTAQSLCDFCQAGRASRRAR